MMYPPVVAMLAEERAMHLPGPAAFSWSAAFSQSYRRGNIFRGAFTPQRAGKAAGRGEETFLEREAM